MAAANPGNYGFLDMPPNWTTNTPASMRVKLDHYDPDCMAIHQLFTGQLVNTINGIPVDLVVGRVPGNLTVKMVERVQNKNLMEMYNLRKHQLSPNSNEKMMAHGTAYLSARDIASDGFNERFIGQNGTFGKGFYVTKFIGHALKYTTKGKNRYRVMILTRVLCGRSARGKPHYDKPPKTDSTGVPFNTTVDNIMQPTVYVSYRSHDVYPAFLVYFVVEGDSN